MTWLIAVGWLVLVAHMVWLRAGLSASSGRVGKHVPAGSAPLINERREACR